MVNNINYRRISSIGEIAVFGSFGYKEIRGRFKIAKSSSLWVVTIPEQSSAATQLQGHEDDGVLLINNGQSICNGIIRTITPPNNNNEIYILVQQDKI